MMENADDVSARVASGVLESDEDHHQESNLYSDEIPISKNSHTRSMIKILVNDNTAGAIIGKAGTTIGALQEECGARIKVSQGSDYYPGTKERTIVIMGTLDPVLKGQHLIWEKISENVRVRDTSSERRNITGKIAIPVEAAGLVIGKGGSSIKGISEDSGARIQLGTRESEESKLTKERVITISGQLDSCSKATELILLKLQEDPLAVYHNKSTTYYRPSHGSVKPSSNSLSLTSSFPSGAETISQITTIELAIPNSLVGNIIGKRGSIINDIQQLSGAKVVISSRSEDDDNDENQMRKVTITGSPANAQIAQTLISNKLNASTSTDKPRRSVNH